MIASRHASKTTPASAMYECAVRVGAAMAHDWSRPRLNVDPSYSNRDAAHPLISVAICRRH